MEILFEFTNPDSLERKVLVGFQAPSSAGDVSDSLSSVTQIRDLRVMVGGKLLPYVQMAAECEDCPLDELSKFDFSQFNQGVFVSLFEVTFKPGFTEIHHSYSFPASSHVYFDQIYGYILRTGAKWASSTIADLTVMMDMGPNTYFYVNDVFGATAQWSILGTGKLTSATFNIGAGTTARMVRLLSGKLMINVKDLQPKENIEFGVITVGSFLGVPTQNNEQSDLSPNVAVALSAQTTDLGYRKLPPLDKDELRLLRNLLYARYGYTFKDAALQQLVEGFAWYVADPNLRAKDIPFTSAEQRFLAEIVRKENE